MQDWAGSGGCGSGGAGDAVGQDQAEFAECQKAAVREVFVMGGACPVLTPKVPTATRH